MKLLFTIVKTLGELRLRFRPLLKNMAVKYSNLLNLNIPDFFLIILHLCII